VLEASKLGPSLVLCILGIKLLLEFPLESFPSGGVVRSSLDVITPTMPPNKGYIFEGEGRIAEEYPSINVKGSQKNYWGSQESQIYSIAPCCSPSTITRLW